MHLPTAPMLQIGGERRLRASPFFGQLSREPLLACAPTLCLWIDNVHQISLLVLAVPTSGSVKVFGCRPHDDGATHSGAGVRKPPREETAGRRALRSVRRYGDFGAGGLLPTCVDCLFGK